MRSSVAIDFAAWVDAPKVRQTTVDVPVCLLQLPGYGDVTVTGDPLRLQPVRFRALPSFEACCTRVLERLNYTVTPVNNDDFGLEAAVQRFKACLLEAKIAIGTSMEDLAQLIEHGAAVVAVLDAGALWNWAPAYAGSASHAVIVTATVRDGQDGGLVGFMIADPAADPAEHFVLHQVMRSSWLEFGGLFLWVDFPEIGAKV